VSTAAERVHEKIGELKDKVEAMRQGIRDRAAEENAAASTASVPTVAPIEDADGYLLDEFGEIIGYREANPERDGEQFHVTNANGAAWVLAKMMDAEASLAGIAAKQKAILENIAAERRTHEQRLAFFRFRYAGELELFARDNLPRGKKTWTCPWGSVSFRKVPAGVEVTDEAQAIEWCRVAGLTDGIKIKESLLISKVADALMADPPPLGHGIEIRKESEKCTIKTGVKS
jgi:phage host-nuclease inhibitor protein Gam